MGKDADAAAETRRCYQASTFVSRLGLFALLVVAVTLMGVVLDRTYHGITGAPSLIYESLPANQHGASTAPSTMASPSPTPAPTPAKAPAGPAGFASVQAMGPTMFAQPIRYAEGVRATISSRRLTPDNSKNIPAGALATVELSWRTASTHVRDIGLQFYGDRLHDRLWDDFKARRPTDVPQVIAAVPFFYCWALRDIAGSPLGGKCALETSFAATSKVSANNSCVVAAGVVTCRVDVRAPPMRTGLFNLAFRVTDAGYADPAYPEVGPALDDVAFVEVEVTCSNGKYCDGEERFVGLKCQPNGTNTYKPCFRGEGDCLEYACFDTPDGGGSGGGTCSQYPVYTFPEGRRALKDLNETLAFCKTSCDTGKCNPLCKKKDECGANGCLLGCYRDKIETLGLGFVYNSTAPADWKPLINQNLTREPLYADGRCTGLYRSNGTALLPTTCVENRCLIAASNARGACSNPYRLFGDLEQDATYAPLDTRPASVPGPGPTDSATGPTGPIGPVRDATLVLDNVIPPQGFEGRFLIDTSLGADQVKLECGAPGVREIAIRIQTPPAWRNGAAEAGFEMRSYGRDGEVLDTVLEIRQSCTTLLPFPTGTCSDDSIPPGNFGSRIFGQLAAGREYVVLVSGYSDTSTGPGVLEVWVSGSGCTPQCEGKGCGSDGCTPTRGCGVCGGGQCCFACQDDAFCRFGQNFCIEGAIAPSSESGVCAANQTWGCFPDCAGRTCGPSANRCPFPGTNEIQMCGPRDGDCKSGQFCDLLNGRCVPVKACEGMTPECATKAGKEVGRGVNSKNSYCANDCTFHKVDEPLIDLVIGGADLTVPGMQTVWTEVSPDSPALAEGCIAQSGLRALFRFDTWVLNYGTAGYYPPAPSDQPNNFEYSYVHAHWHFLGFARFDLFLRQLYMDPLVLGGKLAYCMEVTLQFLFGPRIACTSETSCDNQGIDVGGGDLYSRDLDCQWLDITDVLLNASSKLAGKTGVDRIVYFVAEANFDRSFPEYSYDNNRIEMPVYVPTLAETFPQDSGATAPAVGFNFDYRKYLCAPNADVAVRQRLAYPREVYAKMECPGNFV